RSRRAFPDHGAGVLVPPKAEESRMTQLAVLGPLGVADLGHEDRLRPMRALSGERASNERRSIAFERSELAAEEGQRLGVEPGPDLPRVHEVAVLVVAEEQGPEIGA